MTLTRAGPSPVTIAAEGDALYRLLVEGVRDYAIIMLDPAGYVSSWNPGAERFKGYLASEIIGQHFSVFYTPEDRAADRPAQALEIARSAGRFEDRAWRVRQHGTRFRAHVIIDPIRDPQGGIIGYAKITRDISEAHAQELALRESEQRFRLLVSGVTDYAIYMLDLDGRINSWNAGAERFKGYQAAEILGHHFSTFYTAEDRAAGRPARALRIAREEGRFEDSGWRLRKDGRQFWAHVIIDMIRDDHGEPIGFAKITRDVSERRAADLRLRELMNSHRELEQFIHIASHDLREPLRKILVFSDLLLDEAGLALGEAQRGYVQSMQAATRRMQALLASLLDLSRITSEGRSFNPCRLADVLDDVRADLQLSIRERNAVVEVGPLPDLEADAAQMRQLFQNLLENALKYASPDRRPEIRVSQANDPDEAMLTVVIDDNGIGFDPQYAERIFGVFQRLHTRDQYAGAGIGLAVCRKICGRHGGTITAEGRPGQGARFVVRLLRRHRPDAE